MLTVCTLDMETDSMSQDNAVVMSGETARMQPRRISYARQEALAGIVFAAPWLLNLLFLTLIPLAASLYFSFSEYQIVRAPVFWGTRNYVTLFTNDRLFIKSLWNTVYMVLLGVPIRMVLGMGIALLMNTKVKGRALFRTMYYLPSQVSGVAFAMLWGFLLNPQYGVVSNVIWSFGVRPPLWLADPLWVKPSFVIMSLWGVGGTMIIWLAGLQSIPEGFYEAAEIDGAGRLRRFTSITLPLLSPTTFFVLVTGIIGTFQIFTQAYVLTAGGPADASLFYALYLYQQAFQFFKMGYASAMAWVLFVIIMALTLLQLRLARSWVYYEAER
jgi:multiple sugar transport system permease protein